MPHAYTEDQLVEQPAIELLALLSWAVAGPPSNAGVAREFHEEGFLQRETKGKVVWQSRLRAALERLSPAPREAITATKQSLLRTREPLENPACQTE
jgi:type I restriction enzyme R subunit